MSPALFFFKLPLAQNARPEKSFHMFIHLEKLSLLYPVSLFTLSVLMLLSMYKYHSLSFQVGRGLNYGL